MNKWNENNVVGVRFNHVGTEYISIDIGNGNVGIKYSNGELCNKNWGTRKELADKFNVNTYKPLEEPKNQEFNIWN